MNGWLILARPGGGFGHVTVTVVDITLLGPQRKVAAARAAVAELMPEGPIATINAGWQERESDSAELADVLGGRMVNLELHRRWVEICAEDPAYEAAERRLADLLTAQQEVYALRLHHATAALRAVARRTEVPSVHATAVEDAIEAVRALDTWHLAAVADLRTAFYVDVRLGEHPGVLTHRAVIEDLLDGSRGLVVAGGHVGVLLHLLHVFGLSQILRGGPVRGPVIAWSAGAMALSDRVVLFHDHFSSAAGDRSVLPAYARVVEPDPRPAELYAEGLGLYAGVLPFPHARRRLRFDDPAHLGQLAARLAPRRCLLLPDGARVDLVDGAPLPAGARWLTTAGVTTDEREAAASGTEETR